MMIYNGGRAVQVSYGGNLSRKEEREALNWRRYTANRTRIIG